MAERVAILCIANNYGPPRMAQALATRGVEVCIVAPPGSYASLTRFKHADLLLLAEEIQTKLPSIIGMLADDYAADLVLCGDDIAFLALARLVTMADRVSISPAAHALLRRSMPDAARASALARDGELALSRSQSSCPSPESIANPTANEAVGFAESVGFPVLLKRDGFSAGRGVHYCGESGALAAAIDELRRSAARGGYLVQKLVAGAIYAVNVAGLQGRAPAAFSFAKHLVHPSPFGPTSVAKCHSRTDIIADAREIFESYGLSGFAGIDYVINADDQAHFLEINPRITPTSHLGEIFGVDLAGALVAQLRGEPSMGARSPQHEYVALYPNEWMRNAASPYLTSGYHDVPADDPEVCAAMRVGKR